MKTTNGFWNNIWAGAVWYALILVYAALFGIAANVFLTFAGY